MLDAGAADNCPATAQTRAIEKIDRMAKYPQEVNRNGDERSDKCNNERNMVQIFILYGF
jgi:hypothetical protein